MKTTMKIAVIAMMGMSFGLKAQDNKISTTGDVGIGTTTPNAKLEVKGETIIDGGIGVASSGVLQIRQNGDTFNDGIALTSSNSTSHRLWKSSNGNLNIGASSNPSAFVNTISGDIGIGTTIPKAKLHVYNGNNSYGVILANANEHKFSLYTKTLTTQPVNVESFRIGLKHDTNENNGYISFYRGESGDGGFLGFSTHGIERLRISKTGDIGIGTTLPSAKLEVNGNAKFGDDIIVEGASPNIVLTDSRSLDNGSWDNVSLGSYQWKTLDGTSPGPRIGAEIEAFSGIHAASGPEFGMRFKTSTNLDATPSVKYEISSKGDHDFKNGNAIFGGKVGIGTTSPSHKLSVSSSDNSVMELSSGTSGTWMDFENTAASAGSRLWSMGHAGNSGKFGIYQRDNTNAYRLYITKDGKVGIGTNNPKGFELGVNGKVAATEVKVATYSNWSDFVFYDDYQLPTLKEVEAHIQEKGHLKDIPSAEEVAKEGFYLGAMDAKLLQKIEELTLYTIEQEKKIQKLEKENTQLKTINKQLLDIQNRLKSLEEKK